MMISSLILLTLILKKLGHFLKEFLELTARYFSFYPKTEASEDAEKVLSICSQL